MARMNGGSLPPLRIEQLVFLQPLALADQERRAVQLLVRGNEQEGFGIEIVSRGDVDAEWEVHAEATVRLESDEPPAPRDVAQLRAGLPEPMSYAASEDEQRGLEIGDRWNLSVQQLSTNPERDTLLAHLSLPEQYRSDRERYHFHPALLDTAVNAANHLGGEGALYLPFSYKRLEVYAPLPLDFHALLHRKPATSQEAFHLDVELIAPDGTVCARATDYTVKRVSEGSLDRRPSTSPLHTLALVPAPEFSSRPEELPEEPLLLVRGEDAESVALAESLRAGGVKVAEVITPRESARPYPSALEPLAGRRFSGLVYAPGWTGSGNAGELDRSPEALLYDLFDFIQAITTYRLRAPAALLLTRNGFAVEGESGNLRPHSAALGALARIAGMENPQLPWRCVDYDRLPDGAALLAELGPAQTAQGPDHQSDLAVWRQGVCYREQLQALPEPAHARFTPRREGVYLITGGTGALGLELASLMVSRGEINLALIGSTPLPPRDEWEDILLAEEANDRDRRRIGRLLALAEAGARVECIAADVADAEQMERVLQGLRSEFGRINGVVHAAGRAGEGFLHTKSRETFAKVIAPKIDGARILHDLTQADPLDFFIMYSSVATVLRSPGQSDYTAANAYLDALARYRRGLGLPAVAVCWPAWREVGIAVEYGAVDEMEFFSPISNAEALPLLEQLLCDEGRLPPVVVASELNAQAGTEPMDRLGIELTESTRKHLRRASAPRNPNRAQAGTAEVVLEGLEEEDEITRTVASLWSRILGVTELSVDDAFGDHGGNSILTTQLYREYEALYPGVLDVVDLFSHTTVREQAGFIRKALGADEATGPDAPQGSDLDMDTVLARLADGTITAEEAEAFLSN
jgi:polyketide synthase PksN